MNDGEKVQVAQKALQQLREELPRLVMPSASGGSLRVCERIIADALIAIEAEAA
mgnify:CR=1 FL=1